METEQLILKVLIVDDELPMGRGAERCLRDYSFVLPQLQQQVNFHSLHVDNVVDFNNQLESGDYQIILLDYKMPDCCGLDLLSKIKKNYPHLVTVMVTAYASLETAISATKLGSFDFLPKPFLPDELRNVVQKAATHYLLGKHARDFAAEKRRIRYQFISILSHELKAPIAAVEGYLNLLKGEEVELTPESSREMIERGLIRMEGMKKLIYDLLDLTRLETKPQQRGELVTLDLVKILRTSIEKYQEIAQKREIKIVPRIVSPVTILGDETEFVILFDNLISNAIKYNLNQGRVDIELFQDDQNISYVVTDTGIGIAPRDQARLFSDFVRIKNSATAHILGTGLGLSIAKKVAHLYGGEIRVESTQGLGTKFHVQLPSV